MAIALRYAARSDVGLVRQTNQDSAYAGPHLLVVADGMGGHAGGDIASSLAIGEMAPLDDESHGPDALEHLSKAVGSAHAELLGRVGEEPQLAGMGTTVTALLRSGSKLALAHIGDSRAYLLRDGVLVQITRDHTFVQTLVDEGRLTPEEAEQHPQRSVLMRVLSDVVEDVEPDLSMREARVGDRYLLCSDGLSGVVSFETLRDTLAKGDEPGPTCEHLVQLALRGGAPDNVTCIVADIIEAADLGDAAPAVVGAASHQRGGPPTGPRTGASPAERAAALTAAVPVTELVETVPPKRPRGAIVRRVVGTAGIAVVVVAAVLASWQWVNHQYFVGARDGAVAVFRGLPETIGPVHLAWLHESADDVKVSDLPVYAQERVRKGIPAKSEPDARQIVGTLRQQAADCRAAASPSPSVSPAPTSPTTPGVSPSATVPSPSTSPSAASPTTLPTASSTVGTPATAVNPQATLPSASGSPSPSGAPEAGCGGIGQ